MNLHMYVIGKIFQVVASNWDNLDFKKVAVVQLGGEGNFDEDGTLEEQTEDIDYFLYSFEKYH